MPHVPLTHGLILGHGVWAFNAALPASDDPCAIERDNADITAGAEGAGDEGHDALICQTATHIADQPITSSVSHMATFPARGFPSARPSLQPRFTHSGSEHQQTFMGCRLS